MNRAADAGDNEHHHQAQRVELQPEIHLQAADGQPVDVWIRPPAIQPFAAIKATVRDETDDDGADGQSALVVRQRRVKSVITAADQQRRGTKIEPG